MTTYKLANGRTVSDDDLVRDAEAWESGAWQGTLDNIHVGPAAIADEERMVSHLFQPYAQKTS